MKEMKIMLTNEEMESLKYITNGNTLVKVSDFIPFYSEFIGPELSEIAQDMDLIQFYSC